MLVPLCAALALALAVPAKSAGSGVPAGRVTSARGSAHAAKKARTVAKAGKAAAPPVRAGRVTRPTTAPSKPERLHARATRVPAEPRTVHRESARARPRAPATSAPAQRPSAKPMRLDRAQALLAAVKRDPAKRRYRHHWERAIAALQAAARGKDKGPALLEAAHARYALYRFSQVESDRDAALALADRARRAGAREAATFAAAVRAEMGEDEPAPARPPARKTGSVERLAAKGKPAAPPPKAAPAAPEPRTAAKPPPAEEEPEPSLDPALQEALGDEVEEAAPAPLPSGPARVSELRTWSNAGYTRVAIYLSHPAEFSKEELPAEDGERRRLALDLKGAVLAKGLNREVGDTQVARVRAAQRGDGVRVVLDLAGDEGVSVVALQDPPRILVDVGAAAPPGGGEPPVAQAHPAPKQAESAEVEPAPEPKAEPPGRAEPPRVATRSGPVRRVIVDAGHGGHDTGAIGPTGVREKDVTLGMARKLAEDLRGRGFEVILTRSDDRFVPLEERAAIANARRGDLFVSLHANAHPRRDQRGVESWILNVADGRYAKRLAARENGALRDDAEGATDVRRVLTDLDAQASAGASRKVAELVQENVCANIRAHYGEVRDLGVKSALFYVLVGARMPAVLVEASFISNRVEEKRLASARFQQGVADGVARAVEAYARRQERLAAR